MSYIFKYILKSNINYNNDDSYFQVLQYKQKCSELENQMAESAVYDTNKVPISVSPTTSVLDAAHQTLREIREEQIHDLDTALKKLGEERKRYYPFLFLLMKET